ncbi:hypothetical protein ACJMK2_005139, partial [Sinanodonta woodiana]
VFRQYLMFCGIGLTNAQLFELSVQEYKRNKLLLQLAKGVFEEQSNLEKLVQKIMLESQDLLKCERCSVYLVDNTSVQDSSNQIDGKPEFAKFHSTKEVVFAKAFDLFAKDGACINVPSAQELERSRNTEIAKYVVVNGQPFSIPDLEMDGRFGKGPFVDADGFKTKSILCMPILTSNRIVIGVTHFINKLNGQPFDESDLSIIEAFSIFTGLGIHNCQMYENACRLMAKQTVAIEIMSYHATAQHEETNKIMQSKIPSAQEIGLYTFEFNDIPMSDDDTVRAVISMFQDAGIIEKYKVPYDVMVRWTCSVKKNYRPVTYHNWRHAFNVTQTMFTMLYTGGLRPIFEDLEEFAMLVACLCHDLDHRGTNNAFQVKVASPLAMLYSTSVMEHHHFDHCIMILNSEGNNILQHLSAEEYKSCIKTLEHCILSTDLALYFKKRGDFKKMIESGDTDFKIKAHRYLLIAMMMTACDVAAITKPWEIQHQIAQMVANEFFEQGDIEKTRLGQTPIAMMDREKQHELPKMQVGFIDAICLPVYELFSGLWKELTPMYGGCMNNRKHWEKMADANEQQQKADTGS